MAGKYNNFKELASQEQEGIDYRIHFRKIDSKYAIMAPHGGQIERGTKPIADAIAGENHAYYCFEALKQNRRALHISSNKFDEPKAIAIASQADIVIAMHGAYGMNSHVYFGGLHEELKQAFIDELNEQGFKADHDPSPTRQGKGKTNICNLGKLKQGVQIEMTLGFRKSLFNKPNDEQPQWTPNDKFNRFVETIRNILNHHTETDN